MRQHFLETKPFEAGFAAGGALEQCSVRLSPRQNRLLAALPKAEYERLMSALESVPLLPGSCLHGAGDRDKHLYFPVSGIVARSYVLEDGAQAGFSLVGNDGVLGVASFLSGDTALSRAIVMSAGYAYRLRADVLRAEFARSGALARLLLRYTMTMITQVSQIAVCNRFHSVDQQLCRLVLSCLDRLQTSELVMTQELLADTLGVRREGITEATGRLRAAGLIRNSRNHVTVLDRAGIEARTCECYAAVKRECERLLPPDERKDLPGRHGRMIPATFRIAGARRRRASVPETVRAGR